MRASLGLAAPLVFAVAVLGCASAPRQCDDKPTRLADWRAVCTTDRPGPPSTVEAAHAAGAADIPRLAGDPGGTAQPVCATPVGRCVARFERVVPVGTACHCTSAGQRVAGVTVPGWDP